MKIFKIKDIEKTLHNITKEFKLMPCDFTSLCKMKLGKISKNFLEESPMNIGYACWSIHPHPKVLTDISVMNLQ